MYPQEFCNSGLQVIAANKQPGKSGSEAGFYLKPASPGTSKINKTPKQFCSNQQL